MEKTVAFILMLDRSGSMYNAIRQVRIDANAFIGECIVGDQFGVNAFETDANWVYPTGSSPQIVTITEGEAEIESAKQEIDKIDTGNMTNMGDAIKLGNAMIAQASADVKAFVLLSDGWYNHGPDPVAALGGQPPLYVAGLGNCRESNFSAMLRKNPASMFYYQPHSFEMMYMFNQIRADSAGAALDTNHIYDRCSGSYYTLDDFFISEQSHARVSVVWSDKRYFYTPDMAGDYKVFAALIGPDGKRLSLTPEIAEGGFCIFDVKDAPAGNWKVLTEYSTPNALKTTVGVIDRNPGVNAVLDIPATSKAGEPLAFDIKAYEDGSALEDIIVGVHMTQPVISVDEALVKYEKDLDKINITPDTDEQNIPLAKLRQLKADNPSIEVFERRESRKFLSSAGSGRFTLSTDDTAQAGIYTVEAVIEGTEKKTGLKFRQMKSRAVVVE